MMGAGPFSELELGALPSVINATRFYTGVFTDSVIVRASIALAVIFTIGDKFLPEPMVDSCNADAVAVNQRHRRHMIIPRIRRPSPNAAPSRARTQRILFR